MQLASKFDHRMWKAQSVRYGVPDLRVFAGNFAQFGKSRKTKRGVTGTPRFYRFGREIARQKKPKFH
jgi:hypothetical protein